MTVTELPSVHLRTRTRSGREPAPVSQRTESLLAVLDDPALSGWHEQARAELARLTATVLEA